MDDTILTITERSINQSRRPFLSSALKEYKGYLLSGHIDISKQKDKEKLVLLLEKNLKYKIAQSWVDIYNKEHYKEIDLDSSAVSQLSRILAKSFRFRKESTGRTPKYGKEDAEKIRTLKAEGKSIRAIADELSMSTRTVQKLMKM